MQLYKDYVKERLGNEVIEFDGGFAEYRIHNGCAEIVDMYVSPENRGKKLSHSVVKRIEDKARLLNCSKVYCQVDINQKQAERSIMNNLKYGFKIVLLDRSLIIFEKDI